MSQVTSIEIQELLFTKARTHHSWQNQAIDDDLLHQLYDLAKWGPTSANSTPARIVFLKTSISKDKLYPALMGSNVDQVKAAPITAIVAQDLEFYEKLPKLAPHMGDARSWFAGNGALIESTAFRNSSLQGAYIILAARMLGLDVCPMSGFDNTKVDEAFFKDTSWRSNFICNLGYGDPSKLHPRAPRLDFTEACKIL